MSKHVGLLQQDSQGLHLSLERLLDAHSLQYLIRAYKTACREGALDEGTVIRADGASYNPRPARLCQVLLSETDIVDPILLATAFFIPAKDTKTNTNDEFYKIRDNGSKIRETVENGTLKGLDPSLIPPYSAHLLDIIRHLHMSAISESEKQLLAGGILTNVLPHIESSRLKTLIESACLRVTGR